MQPRHSHKALTDYLKPGVNPGDIPGLSAILRVQSTIDVFMALFRGNNEDVIIRLMLLREIGERSDAPNWSSHELKNYFTFLDPAKFESALGRLKEYRLLQQDEETGDVSVSSIGRMILSTLTTLLQAEQDEDSTAIGFILGQVSANEMIGNVSAEQLQHLLSRLNELLEQFDRDILSGSEYRIRDAEKRLSNVWQWLERGTDMIKSIASSPDIDPVAHKVAQKIGRVQSRILRLTSVFQRILNQFESQKIHLGQSGLSSSDIAMWLRRLNVNDIANLIGDNFSVCPQPAFAVTDVMMDIAEYELIEREHAVDSIDGVLPEAQVAAVSSADSEPQDNIMLSHWLEKLESLNTSADLPDFVPTDKFEETAYRLSLLALLQDRSAQKLPGIAAELAKLPLELEILTTSRIVNSGGIHRISEGKITKR